MRPEEGDLAYVWDMHMAAEEIGQFVAGLTVKGFLTNTTGRRAVERNLEIIGQAASSVSREFRIAHAELPWAAIVAQRNVLAHQYGDIDFVRIWRVATVDVPELIRLLGPLVATLPPES
ncbi:MAG: DUF86 domain-containing protein [Chloroflexota bacterium]|nr:DUF86 domain-containing protein [Chloroflexota bacterium]